MTDGRHEYLLSSVDRGDLEWLASAIADVVAEPRQQGHGPRVIASIDVLDLLDLDLIASSVGGITDPLGQLRQWLEQQLKAVAEWIVNTLGGLIDQLIKGLYGFLEAVFNTLTTSISALADAMSTLIDIVTRVVVDPILQALQWVSENFPRLIDLFMQAVSAIEASVKGIADAVSQVIAAITEEVSKAVSGVLEAVHGLVSAIIDTLSGIPAIVQDIVATVVDTIVGLAATITDAVRGAIDTVLEYVSGFAKTVLDITTSVIDAVSSSLAGLVNTIQGFMETVMDYLGGLAETVSELVAGVVDTVTGALGWLVDTVTSIAQSIVDALAGIPGVISDTVATLVEVVANAFQGLLDLAIAGYEQVSRMVTQLADTIAAIMSAIAASIEELAAKLQEAMAGAVAALMQQLAVLGEALSSAIKSLVDYLAKAAETIVSSIQAIASAIAAIPDMVAEAVSEAARVVAEKLNEILDTISGWIGRLIDSIASIVDMLRELPAYIEQALGVVAEFIKKLPRLALELVEDMASFIWEHMPEWVRKVLENIPKVLDRVAVALTGFINAILKFPEWFPIWFKEYIAEPIVTVLKTIAQFFENALNFILQVIREGPMAVFELAKTMAKGAIDYVSNMVRLGFTAIETARDIVEEIARRVADILAEPISELIGSLFKVMRKGFAKILDGKSIVEVYTDFFKAIIPYTVSTVALVETMRAIGEEVSRFTSMVMSMAVQGGGAEGAPLIALANTIDRGAWQVVSQLPWSIAFWMAEPLRKPLEYATRYAMRNELPIEIPTLTMIRDMIRRNMAAEDGAKVYEWIIQFAKLRGYSDQILELLYSLEKPVTKVMDRFGGKRTIPLSLLWDVPTRSDLVRMLQRDVFASPMEWARFIIVHGLNEDLGKMYYMMSFEYPSFTQLWEFFVRGISGMLWYQAPDFIKQWFTKDAEWLGAGIPVDPKRLNYDYNALFKAIPFYMKWIQKSNFSWFRKGAKIQYGDLVIDIDFDWTADSWMLWDIAADLPGKIDARWMAKWALFDLISLKAGVGVPQPGQAIKAYPEAPFVDLVTQVVEDTMASSIYMDLRAFSRLLVANGLHPAWVPITAVAEAINALSEERTLLRTGFINLFKEGFWDYKTIDTLLDGFFIASFAVEYFDPAVRKWKAGAINVPIKFLPGERRLLELRAAMDRALDILRDLVRELNRSYAEHIIIGYDDYLAHLREGIDKTNAWFKPLVRELTGKELALRADMAYWGAYAKVVEMYRELYTMRRIRYWIGRIITWSIYRLAAEYITIDDVKMIVGMFSQYGRLTRQEIEMLEKVMEVMVGIAKREYIPTPSQLASIVEVVPEAIKLMDVVFEKRHVPEEWRSIWAKYIEVKPIVGDVRGLLTAYRRAKVYGVELGKLEEEILELAKTTGWTERELRILALRIQVEELIEETRELRKAYLPTPTMLATLAEYVPIPVELVKRTLEARRVPKEWIGIWLRYIEVRPLADEARMLATVFFKARRYGVPLGDLEKQVLEILKELGFTPRELELRELRATIEAMIDQWREAQREYIPTPSMLATIAEIVPVARQLMERVFEARNVPIEWRSIWAAYIQMKPVVDEVRRYVSVVVNMYEYFTIPKDELVKALDSVKAFGYEDVEIQFIVATADLERALRAYRELIGTPRQLLVMAEYSPTARRIALAEVYKMIDALPTDQQTKEFLKKMWEEYIRVRPVYDEVRRYVTELVNDYANGVITRDQLVQELEELKQWGLDDYEIQFYIWLAEKRRIRYAARYQR